MAAEPLSLVRAPSPSESPAARPPWSLARCIAFRFAFVYLGLYCFPYPLNELPKGDKLTAPWDWLLHHVVPWFGHHVLHIAREIPLGPNGSGDTTYDWVLTAASLTFAIVATLVWSIVDRRRRRYDLGWALLRIYLRYTLAMTMFSYGFAKVFDGQFLPPPPARLAEPFGESSPMGLLWTFMGASKPYTVFAGLAELAGGALLLFRRTTTLGALVLLGVLGNVVLLNLCYDVPVKLYSSHLWVMALVLVLPDAARLFDVLVRNRPTTAASMDTPFARGRWRWIRLVGKPIFILNLLYTQGYQKAQMTKKYRQDVPQGAMSGVWEVVQATSDGHPLAWRRLGIDNHGFGIRPSDGQHGFALVDDGAKKTLTLTPFGGPTGKPSVLVYTRDASGRGTLDGTFEGKPLHAELRWIDTSKSLLTTRGFHWINESPFNR